MPRPKNSIPTLRRNKMKGQPDRAFVQVSGNRVYLGEWGSREARAAYARFIAEFVASDGFMPVQPSLSPSELLVVELIVRYDKFAKRYYVKNGKQTDTVAEVKSAMKPLRDLYGKEPVNEFIPVRLRAVRQVMLDGGRLSRTSINKRVDIIRRMFKWGVAEGIVEEATYRALTCVDGLRAGKTEAREPEPVTAIPDAVIEQTRKHCPPVIQDMIRFQRLTGARPAEVCIMKAGDINTSGEVWTYVPSSHKTEHRGKKRTIFIGPQAQAVLAGYLMDREPDAYVFSPAESERLRSIDRRRNRKTPVQPSQQNRGKKNRKRKPRDRYTPDSFRRAVYRACDKAGVDQWSPNQLRHTAGTIVREQFGLEAAQVVLGHSKADTTQIYAERDQKKAAEAMKKLG